MPNVDGRIAAWRRPFEDSVIYSPAAIEELEDHVWSLLAQAASKGVSVEEALDSALSEVGSEGVLREGFLAAWREMSPLRRWRQLVRAEGRSTSQPAIYRVVRLGSLCVGLFGCFMLSVMTLELIVGSYRPHLSVDWSKYLYLQGSVLYLTLALTGLFNVIPFRPWTGNPGDWARALFALWTVVFAAPTIPLALGALPTQMVVDGIEPFFWVALILIGPAAWIWQLWRRKPETVLVASSIWLQPVR